MSATASKDQAHAIAPAFAARYHKLMAHFFSRNPKLWPCFAHEGFRRIVAFRQRCLPPSARLAAYPDGLRLQTEIMTEDCVAPTSRVPDGTPDEHLLFTAALSKDWENPASVENVITMPCDPAIYGTMLGSLANPNLVYAEYAGMADQLEKNVIRQIATLAGYDPQQATGIFTQGGTFCNLYGYLAGIRKSLPEAKRFGMGYIHDYRIINSQGGHYSNITNLSLLGVDITKRTIRIKLNQNNDIDFDDLEKQLRSCFQLKCVVPTIMLTMGTTDTFAVDRVKPVSDMVDRLCALYEVQTRPHIHVDSAIGWSLLFFLDYDFMRNPLDINTATLEGLKRNTDRFRELKYADSFTVDFQKWGYVPYTSSLVMFRDRRDLQALENDPQIYTYFERQFQGHTHMTSTIECSRGATGVFGAYAALRYLGVEGYRTAIAHCLQNANYFRHRLSSLGCARIIASENQGPSVGFRLYNPDRVKNPDAEFDFEYHIQPTAEYRARLDYNNQWHRETFTKRGKVGLFTNWVEFIAHTAYDEQSRFHQLPGEKAVFMNPATQRADIDTFIAHATPLNIP